MRDANNKTPYGSRKSAREMLYRLGVGLATLGTVSMGASTVASHIGINQFDTAITSYIEGNLGRGATELKNGEYSSDLGAKLGVGGGTAALIGAGLVAGTLAGKKRKKAS